MMHSFLTRIFSLLFILSFSFETFSQSAVQVIPSVLPPYSTLLSEYYSGDQTRLSVTLLNTDAAEPFLQGYLRISIEGQGVKLQSVPFGNYPTIDLMTGAPVTVSQSDLAPYFSPQHLQGTGAGNQNRLPEGYYQFCFEVLEKNTGRLIGTKQCAQAYLTLSDPAFLVLPEKGKVISYTNPFNLLFQWTPRHINILNSEYEFALVEIWDEGIAPEAAFYTGKPIYTTTTNTSNLFYGPAEPQLLMGKKYAWRVKTKVTTSNNELEPFKNDGYSEIFWFKLQGECPPLQKANVVADPRTNKTTLSWVSDPVNIGRVKLDYRKKGTANWKTLEAENNQVTLTGLAWSTDYEYQLGNRCVITDDFAYGNVQSFRTLNQDTSNCIPAPAQPLSNQEPLAALKVGDVIFVADFAMRLTTVSGSNGNFSGEGAVGLLIPTTTTVVGVKATFTNISVNTDYRVFAGKIVSKYDATESNVIDANGDGGLHTGEVKTGNTSAIQVNATINPTIDALVETTITGPGDTTYTVTITSADDKPATITTKKLPVTVQDDKGKIYTIDKNGKITPAGQASSALLAGKSPEQLNQLTPGKGRVVFEANENQVYALDLYQTIYGKSKIFDDEYESLDGGKYKVGNKLLITGSTDKINARVSGLASGMSADSIHFITGKGIEFAAKKTGSDLYEITLLSGPADDAQELYAIYRDSKAAKANPEGNSADFTYSLGKLDIATYDAKQYTVNLVPISNASIDEEKVETQLNRIYNKIGISWTVNKAKTFYYSQWGSTDSTLNITGAGKYNQYSEEMKQLNIAYIESHPDISGTDAYLFVFAGAPIAGTEERGQGMLGDMLRNKQFGYIFQPGNDVGQVVAHELAHGVFHLEHTFERRYYFEQGDLKDNLMDYDGGTVFTKLQWDAVHAPANVYSVFEREGDGSFYAQALKCISAAAIDVAFQYVFKFVELNLLDNKPTGFTDFSEVFGAINKVDLLTSASLSCGAAIIPWPTDKAKLVAVMTTSFGAGASALVNDAYSQYEIIIAQNPNIALTEVFLKIEWGESFKKAGINSVITAIATGAIVYATTNPKFIGFAYKMKTLGYAKISIALTKAGFSKEAVDMFCRKFGVEMSSVSVSVFNSFTKRIDFGGELIKKAGQKLNILGRAYPKNGSIGTRKIYEELVAKGVPENELTGLFRTMPSEWYNLNVIEMNTKYWNEINKVHIDDIIANGGDIRFIHDPRLVENQWNIVSEMDNAAFRTKCIKEGITKLKSYMKMEYDYLVSKGYVFQENGLMVKL